eukprot:476346-Pyramimonas_sp.AAC.1
MARALEGPPIPPRGPILHPPPPLRSSRASLVRGAGSSYDPTCAPRLHPPAAQAKGGARAAR